MKKRSIVYLIISILLLLVLPISVLSIGFMSSPIFNETYYGELPYMFNRLKSTKERKIIFVGNSALAFGLRSDLMEEELGLPVINFALYGAIGTKAMMDLSKVNIGKDDIVVLAPEINEQGLSLYFSSENMWRSIDGHFDMLKYIAKENKESMTGNFPSFAAEKYSYLIRNKKPDVEGVYTQASFNLDNKEVGYMTYQRDYNIMLSGYDANNPLVFDKNYLSDEFIKYINDYASYIRNRGASIYFGYIPMNTYAVPSRTDVMKEFVTSLREKLEFPILGYLPNYIYDYDWFYDNNTHLNSAGMYVYTRQLVEDLKIVLEDDSPTNIVIPEEPDSPLPSYEEGDDSYANYFTYEEKGGGYIINGITEEGKALSSIVIPSTYNDLPVLAINKRVFNNNKNIYELIIPSNIVTLYDESFRGCTKLSRLVLRHTNPNRINVGAALLSGANNCYVYVKSAHYDNFVNHYNWSYYQARLRKY